MTQSVPTMTYFHAGWWPAWRSACRLEWRGRVGACLLATLLVSSCAIGAAAEPDGAQIMAESFRRHQLFPYVYEEQTMVLMDASGNRDVRSTRRYSRAEADGSVSYLLTFDSPPEIRGVALLATRDAQGRQFSGVYLPAFGQVLKSSSGDARGSHFLGTDFALEDLAAEILADYRYQRIADKTLHQADHFVVNAYPLNADIERNTGYSRRQHLVRKDNFFIVRTDYFDRRGRFVKRQQQHDLQQVHGDMWRANMILMEDRREQHQTLLKTDRRVFSEDYVPAHIFSPAWLYAGSHIAAPELPGAQRTGTQAQFTPSENNEGS